MIDSQELIEHYSKPVQPFHCESKLLSTESRGPARCGEQTLKPRYEMGKDNKSDQRDVM